MQAIALSATFDRRLKLQLSKTVQTICNLALAALLIGGAAALVVTQLQQKPASAKHDRSDSPRTRVETHTASEDQIDRFATIVAAKSAPVPPSPYALFEATKRNDLQTLKEAISLGANLREMIVDGRTLLHEARTTDVASCLVGAGIDVNATDTEGITPLHRMITRPGFSPSDLYLVRRMLFMGAIVDSRMVAYAHAQYENRIDEAENRTWLAETLGDIHAATALADGAKSWLELSRLLEVSQRSQKTSEEERRDVGPPTASIVAGPPEYTSHQLQGGSPISLRTHLRAGTKYSYKHNTKVDQVLTGPGIRQRILNNATMWVSVHVVAVEDDGSAQVEFVHDRITSDTSTEPAQFVRQRYDSASPHTHHGDSALVYQPVIDKVIKARVGALGDITVIRGVSDVSIPQHARETFDVIFSDAVIAATYEDFFQAASSTEKALVGESWQLVRDQPDPLGQKSLNLQLTLIQADEDHATIDEKGETSIECIGGPGKPLVKLLESAIEGSRSWDLTTGTLLSLKRTEVDKVQIHTLDNVDLDNSVTRVTEIIRMKHNDDDDASTRTIMGASKEDVDTRLKNWKCMEDKLSNAETRVFRYADDVTLIIGFRDGKAIGVAVIDNPGTDLTGISEARFQELVRTIGIEPKESDIRRDSNGIREFYVGDTESW